MREGHHLENPDVGGNLILKGILQKLNGGIDWIYLTQDIDR
jgi:hypothetical protein